jgi:pimeloyl-ACP methyl ester carboxylesterase
MTEKIAELDHNLLPTGIRSRFVPGVNGLRMHILEAGFEPPGRPCVLLLHGFPELAYSWRKIMVPLAAAGYHVVAPDQRGYGRTTGWDPDYDGDLASFRIPNLARDVLALVSALGYRKVAGVVGHDFGSPVAAYCALIRPDVFQSVALMSAPFDGPPAFPFGPAHAPETNEADIHQELAKLARPRKHYQRYYGTRSANDDMRNCPQGIADFLRAYYHTKSADWAGNKPFRLKSWTAEELAKMPSYYIMDLDLGMAETVAPQMPSTEEIAACRWLTEADLQVYGEAFSRTGFQGGLQWYRCTASEAQTKELRLYSGRTIDQPSCFIAGASDWGIYQRPGVLERMQSHACTRMLSCDLVPGAGHWVQQEQPDAVVELLKRILPPRT